MKTVNISLTDEQAKMIDKTTKTYGFANRSEFVRAVLRLIKTDKSLLEKAATTPFETAKILSLEEIKTKAVPILKKNGVEFAGLFGSYARGEARPDSDIDFLVKFADKAKVSLLDVIGIENELSDLLGKKTQLVTSDGVHPYIKDSVEKDLKIIYG